MDPTFIALSVIILLFSVIVHEVMHGLVAKKFGDRTAENAGRLTLNPIPHIDPIGTILLPALMLLTGLPGLAWAKPVPVNPLNFKDIKTGEIMVSLAGVASNFGLALIATVLFHLNNSIFNVPLLSQIAEFTVFINILLGIFNLFPIPPLDGSKAVAALLPYKQSLKAQPKGMLSGFAYNLAREYDKLNAIGPFILLALVFTGVIGKLLYMIALPITHILLLGRFNLFF